MLAGGVSIDCRSGTGSDFCPPGAVLSNRCTLVRNRKIELGSGYKIEVVSVDVQDDGSDDFGDLAVGEARFHQRVYFRRRNVPALLQQIFGNVSDGDLAIRAALDGVGLARLPLSVIDTHIARKRLVPLLEDWAPRSVGFYLYYPSRRQIPAALKAFIGFIKAHSRADDASQS
jgi:hypothetical protein